MIYHITGFCHQLGGRYKNYFIEKQLLKDFPQGTPDTGVMIKETLKVRLYPLTGVKQLVISGIVTNQCVESAVRDAADRGFYVTVVEDACATHSQNDHDQSLKNMKVFSRICNSQQIVYEIGNLQ